MSIVLITSAPISMGEWMAVPHIEGFIHARIHLAKTYREWWNPANDMEVHLVEGDYANLNDVGGDHNVINIDLCRHIWDTHEEQSGLQM